MVSSGKHEATLCRATLWRRATHPGGPDGLYAGVPYPSLGRRGPEATRPRRDYAPPWLVGPPQAGPWMKAPPSTVRTDPQM